MTHESLLAEPTPPATYLPENAEAAKALADGEDPSSVAARFPAYTAAWAAARVVTLRGPATGPALSQGGTGRLGADRQALRRRRSIVRAAVRP